MLAKISLSHSRFLIRVEHLRGRIPHPCPVSGADRLRPGYQKLMEEASAGEFDVVLAEALGPSRAKCASAPAAKAATSSCRT